MDGSISEMKGHESTKEAMDQSVSKLMNEAMTKN